MPSLMNAKCAQAGCNFGDNSVVVFAGNNRGQELKEVEIFDVSRVFGGWKLLRVNFQIQGNFMSATCLSGSHVLVWGFEKCFEIEFDDQNENSELGVKSITFKRGFEHSCEGGASYKMVAHKEEPVLMSFSTDLGSLHFYREHEWV